MNRAAQLPAATLERINAISDRATRDYEEDLAHQLAAEQAAAHNGYTQALRAHRLNSKPQTAEPMWIDITLAVLFVIGLYMLVAVWDARDVEPVRVDVSKVAVRGSK